MNNLKLVFTNFLTQAFAWLKKRDDNSKLKYKNLVIAVLVLLALIIAISFTSCSNKEHLKTHPSDVDNTEVSFEDNHAEALDPYGNSVNEQVLNDAALNQTDDSALALPSKEQATNLQPTEQTKETFDNPNKSVDASMDTPKGSPFKTPNLNVEKNTNNSYIESEPIVSDNNVSDNSENTEVQSAVSSNGKSTLYCDSFANSKDAESKKANIAMTLGFMSKVVKKDNTFKLQLGPYSTADEAKNVFSKLDASGLVNECSLETQN